MIAIHLDLNDQCIDRPIHNIVYGLFVVLELTFRRVTILLLPRACNIFRVDINGLRGNVPVVLNMQHFTQPQGDNFRLSMLTDSQ